MTEAHIYTPKIFVCLYTQSLNFPPFSPRILLTMYLCYFVLQNIMFLLIQRSLYLEAYYSFKTKLKHNLYESFLDSHKGSVFSLNSVTISHTVYSLYCNNPFKFTSILLEYCKSFYCTTTNKNVEQISHTYIPYTHITLLIYTLSTLARNRKNF